MVLPFPSILSMPSSATARVQKATSSQLLSPDMVMNTDICDAINSDPWLAKDFVKAVKKRLQNKNSKVQLLSLTLLETLIKNCNDFLYFQVVERGILQEMAKLVRKAKSMQLREKLLVLLDSWQEKFGGPQGKYPQFYNTVNELKSSGVEFPKKEANSAVVIAPSPKTPLPQVGFGVPISTIEGLRQVMASERDHFSSSGLDNIRSTLELFSRMLQTLDPEGFEGKKGELVSNLADRCLSHKKSLMHLINSTNGRDHRLLLEALTLNDQFELVLAKYDALASSLALPAEDGEEDEDGFSIIAKRNTVCNSTGSEEAKRPTEGFSSVASHALVPLGPPATATSFKVEEGLPWQSNQSAQKTSNPFCGSESWEQYHSYPQPSLMPNEGCNPFHSYVAPWALPAMANLPWTDMDVASNPFLSTTMNHFSSS